MEADDSLLDTKRADAGTSPSHEPDGLSADLETPGSTAASPFAIPWAGWKQIFKRVWVLSGIHKLSLLSAGVAFFTFLSLTPLITAMVIIYGLAGDVEMVEQQMRSIAAIVPPDVASVIDRQLLAAVMTNRGTAGFALVLTFFIAIYGGSYAVSGLIGALNAINDEHETRSVVKLFARAITISFGGIVTGLMGLVLVSALTWLRGLMTDVLGQSAMWPITLLIWLAVLGLGTMGFALIIRFGPDRHPAKWRWIVPGAFTALVLWIAISIMFSLYVTHVFNYNATYGSLSAFVVFLMWLYLSCYVMLLGAMLNAEIERQTTVDSTVGPEREMGHRGAVLADSHIAAGAEAAALKRQRRREARALQRRMIEEKDTKLREES